MRLYVLEGIYVTRESASSSLEIFLADQGQQHHPSRSRLHRLTTKFSLRTKRRNLSASTRAIMGVWDVFTGKKASQSASPSSSPSDQLLDDSSAATTFSTPTTDDVSSFINTPGTFDVATLHPLAGLNKDTLDYLSLDDSALDNLPGSRSILPSRGWSDDLCYGTGVTYLSALMLGGAWGMAEGLNRLPANAPPKLRLNSVLNSVTRRGPFLGNSAGVVAMLYNGVNSTIGYYRGKHDAFNSVAAGTISGMVFKSTRGVRPMMISGGIVGSIAGAWAVSGTRWLSDHRH